MTELTLKDLYSTTLRLRRYRSRSARDMNKEAYTESIMTQKTRKKEWRNEQQQKHTLEPKTNKEVALRQFLRGSPKIRCIKIESEAAQMSLQWTVNGSHEMIGEEATPHLTFRITDCALALSQSRNDDPTDVRQGGLTLGQHHSHALHRLSESKLELANKASTLCVTSHRRKIPPYSHHWYQQERCSSVTTQVKWKLPAPRLASSLQSPACKSDFLCC